MFQKKEHVKVQSSPVGGNTAQKQIVTLDQGQSRSLLQSFMFVIAIALTNGVSNSVRSDFEWQDQWAFFVGFVASGIILTIGRRYFLLSHHRLNRLMMEASDFLTAILGVVFVVAASRIVFDDESQQTIDHINYIKLIESLLVIYLTQRITFRFYNKCILIFSCAIVISVYLGIAIERPFGEWGLFSIVYTMIMLIALMCDNGTFCKRGRNQKLWEITTPTPVRMIKKKARNYKSVLEALPDGILIIDQKERVQYYNNTLSNLLQVTNTELIIGELLPQVKNLQLEELQKIFDETNKSCNSLIHMSSLHMNKFNKPKSLNEFIHIICQNWNDIKSSTISSTAGDSLHFVDVPKDHCYCLGKLECNTSLDQRTIEIRFKIRHDENGEEVCYMAFSDITERASFASTKEMAEYKNRLLSSVSHELRTPLNCNINCINSALEHQEIPMYIKRKLLTPAHNSAKLLLTIIDDILDLTQIQDGTIQLVMSSNKIVNTVRDAISLLEDQATNKKIAIKLELPDENFNPTVVTDHSKLNQIICNLISNAIKFTFEGNIEVKIEKDPNFNGFKISVTDTGIGISSINQRKIQYSYKRNDLVRRSALNNQGLGIGLVISHALTKTIGPVSIEQGNGTIPGLNFESQEGKGSTFFFSVKDQSPSLVMDRDQFEQEDESKFVIEAPTVQTEFLRKETIDLDGVQNTENPEYFESITPMERSQIYHHQKPSQFSTLRGQRQGSLVIHHRNKSLAKLKSGISPSTINSLTRIINPPCMCPEVLAVDDDSFNIMVLENIIQSLKFSTIPCYNGKEALDIFMMRVQNPCGPECKPFRAIFLDCNMPVIDGYECARKLKELFQEIPDHCCPIIACTASIGQAEKDRCLQAGMDFYTTKPISKEKINNLIKEIKIQ